MSEFAGTAISLANLLLAVRYPFPLYISGIEWREQFPLQAALALAPQLQAAQANRMQDVYKTIIRLDNAASVLYGDFAPESLCLNLSKQHLLCSLPVLAYAGNTSDQDKQHLRDIIRAIRDRLGYAFFESAIHACVGHAQVSQDDTILRCVDRVCACFPNDILSLAQRYGDLMIRLHGAEPFLTMLHRWCDHRAYVSQGTLVEAFDSPLTRAAAMILNHPKLLPILSQEAVDAAFDALSLAERARLLLIWNIALHNIHASSVERKLRLLGFDPSIQATVRTSSDDGGYGLFMGCLLHTPDPNSAHVVLEQACKQSWGPRHALVAGLIRNELHSDEARMRLAQVLINAPAVLHEVASRNAFVKNKIRQLAWSLPDASLGTALEARLAWAEQTYNLSDQCVNGVKNLIINHFGAQLEQLQAPANIAKVYDAMLQDHAWLSVVDETIANILGAHSLMSTMYNISSAPEQGV